MYNRQRWLKAREQVSESIASNMGLYGITHSVGRLYTALFFHHDPMTLEDMMEELGMSKTSMSTGVRNLLDSHMVNKVWKKGVRKDLYEVDMDWYQNFIDYFRIHWRKAIEMNVEAIQKCLSIIFEIQQSNEASPSDLDMMQKDQEKLKEALKYYRWLSELVDCLESGKIFEFIPKVESE